MFIAREIIDGKYWVIEHAEKRIGHISLEEINSKDVKYVLSANNTLAFFNDVDSLKIELGEAEFVSTSRTLTATYTAIGYPTKHPAHAPLFNVVTGLPSYTISATSPTRFAAGYYCIKFHQRGWSTAFCPRVRTLDTYDYAGPFMTLDEAKEKYRELRKD